MYTELSGGKQQSHMPYAEVKLFSVTYSYQHATHQWTEWQQKSKVSDKILSEREDNLYSCSLFQNQTVGLFQNHQITPKIKKTIQVWIPCTGLIQCVRCACYQITSVSFIMKIGLY
jgi:hypothetical protein